MKDLLLHPHTKQQLEQLLLHQPHAILLSGQAGSGKKYTAFKIAEKLLETPVINHPYFLHIQPSPTSITIDQIRQLHRMLKLKTTGHLAIRRVIIIENSHTMTDEAQNAILKILEEPPKDTAIILTASDSHSLKPTIYSRVQKVHLKPVTLEDAHTYLKFADNSERLHLLSGGNMGLLTALADGDTSHPLVAAIEDAKNLISMTRFERLAKIDQLTKQKDYLFELLNALKKVSSSALKQSIRRDDTNTVNRWTRILEETYKSEVLLANNTNPKLLLTELFLHF